MQTQPVANIKRAITNIIATFRGYTFMTSSEVIIEEMRAENNQQLKSSN
ncbi:MAG TPA: hypothetical protein VHA09_03940 [Nitrososphaera sp.]|nr:hypothetical protein [Nitrososphaera sp.]